MSAAEKKTSKKTASSTSGMSSDERAAMKERAAELRTASRRAKGAAKAEAEAQDVLDKIAELPEDDRVLAERVHAVITAAAPALAPKLWYGMPAYAKEGKIVCFFQGAAKFGSRYSTLGFNDPASLDDGSMWPTAFAITEVGKAEEKAITELITKAVG
jgi:uncharacterized protein YdhG (YjbR/CyaY superfamily)